MELPLTTEVSECIPTGSWGLSLGEGEKKRRDFYTVSFFKIFILRESFPFSSTIEVFILISKWCAFSTICMETLMLQEDGHIHSVPSETPTAPHPPTTISILCWSLGIPVWEAQGSIWDNHCTPSWLTSLKTESLFLRVENPSNASLCYHLQQETWIRPPQCQSNHGGNSPSCRVTASGI